MKNKRFGFSLIELLVVIVIMGILATISVGTFQGFFAKARDAKRVATVNSIAQVIRAEHTDIWSDTTRFVSLTDEDLAGYLTNNGIVPSIENGIIFIVSAADGAGTTSDDNAFAVTTWEEGDSTLIADGFPADVIATLDANTGTTPATLANYSTVPAGTTTLAELGTHTTALWFHISATEVCTGTGVTNCTDL